MINAILILAIVLLVTYLLISFQCPRCRKRMKHLGFTSNMYCPHCGLVVRTMTERKP